ncbi:hypothetical protein HK405_012069, partial [Cladochytrium tenue]
NQGGTESINLDARTSSDGSDYNYEDLTATFVDKYNGVCVLLFISSNPMPALVTAGSMCSSGKPT